MNRESYEQRLDELKGEGLDLAENLLNEIPDNASYKDVNEDWCLSLAKTVERYEDKLRDLADEFMFLEEDLEAEEEEEEEEEEEDDE